MSGEHVRSSEDEIPFDLPADWSEGRTVSRPEHVAFRLDPETGDQIDMVSAMLTGRSRTDRAFVAIVWTHGYWVRCVAFGGGTVGTLSSGRTTPVIREAIRFATPHLHSWATHRSRP